MLGHETKLRIGAEKTWWWLVIGHCMYFHLKILDELRPFRYPTHVLAFLLQVVFSEPKFQSPRPRPNMCTTTGPPEGLRGFLKTQGLDLCIVWIYICSMILHYLETMVKHCNYSNYMCIYIYIYCSQSSISVHFFSINSMGVHIRLHRSWEEKRQVTHQTIHEVHHGEEELTCQGLAAQNSKLGINISNMSMNKLFPSVFVFGKCAKTCGKMIGRY